jgi:Periplasmic binding protein-like domain
VAVPADVAVVGFDDIYPASLFDPPLTTIHQPTRMLGERACARLLDRIATPTLPTAVELLPTELVLRSSCGCPPGTLTRRPVEALAASHTYRTLAGQVNHYARKPARSTSAARRAATG